VVCEMVSAQNSGNFEERMKNEKCKVQKVKRKKKHVGYMLKRQIKVVDAQIDGLVYDLYGLTDEEIGIVEEE